MKKFLNSHPGFERDDLQDYRNLFCFITNTRGNPLLKVKKMVYLFLTKKISLKYKDFYNISSK